MIGLSAAVCKLSELSFQLELGEHMTSYLVIAALKIAILTRKQESVIHALTKVVSSPELRLLNVANKWL